MKSLEGCLHATRVNVGEQWLVMNLVMKEGTGIMVDSKFIIIVNFL